LAARTHRSRQNELQARHLLPWLLLEKILPGGQTSGRIIGGKLIALGVAVLLDRSPDLPALTGPG
jgi:hypothetical protein